MWEAGGAMPSRESPVCVNENLHASKVTVMATMHDDRSLTLKAMQLNALGSSQ
jgi:hypothetical protein